MRPSLIPSICLALALTSGACSVDPIDLSGKACPCEEPFVCDDSAGVCVAADAGVGGNAGAGGQSGSAGASGAGGTGGSSGCLSTQKSCNGACVSKTSALYGCTASGCDPCATFANATATCKSTMCSPNCKSGFGDCDGLANTGCEQSVSDLANCGGCKRTCSTTNTTSVNCAAAKCAPTCAAPFGNCTTPSATAPDDGCETNLTASKTHCGACGNSCYAGLVCSARTCGCSSAAHCEGSTGVQSFSCDTATRRCVCSNTTCAAGEVCIKETGSNRCSCNGGAACGVDAICCKSGCADPQTDEDNCGGCGIDCTSAQTCVAGVCT